MISTAKQKQGSQNPLFPQVIAISDLAPVKKVWADYLPPPKNEFILKVNDFDYYTLVKEEIDFDPTQIELFKCEKLVLNEVEALSGQVPWVIEEVEEKINKVYQGKQLESLEIVGLDCKSNVANETFDLMAGLDLVDESLRKLLLREIKQNCFSLEGDVVSRLA